MSDPSAQGYQVLARKYRPATFADLIGQEAMVRTLRNAFATDRIAHAFILTGVRGVGKTTTARIVAKGLNCIGTDGTGGPTTEPCGLCEHCRAIAEGRHVDVLEMDAASRTGVADIRDIIESVQYRSASARYKVYIIDEVHMLSNSAFNALLKTLEEPPPHVKFIFATTEIRKVPVTVLSRCQRFDLRRIEPEVMIAHLTSIAAREGAEIAPEALALITRAAEGSVRDAMSLLDQAIAHGAGETGADQVRAMLGLADRGRVLDLFDMVLKGEAAAALAELGAQYADGADPVAVLRDLAEITHWVSVIKITPDAAEDPTVAAAERARGQAMANAVPMRALTRLWQMLLKALEEVSLAPNTMMAAEMALIRLTHVADLPDPGTLMKRLRQGSAGGPAEAATGTTRGASPQSPGGGATLAAPPRAMAQPSGAATALAAQPETALARFTRFDDVVALMRRMREVRLLIDVEQHLRLVHYAPGRIEFEPTADAPRDLATTLAARLQGWTGVRWWVSLASSGGGKTISETRDEGLREAEEQALQNPVVQAIIAAFPAARFTGIRNPEGAGSGTNADAAASSDDDWDPFEDN
ncbi:DNA polymerase III subunit gamma/tau [Phaeovulum sp.]|uniref:DNA polymerase III subunit gamma/tau n=1 Tax=Phaeovulum sp. TaxID=2934796 RepID=UPI00272EF0F0|nr:DNA polymerase III subunit gamma/tau [Phaeovulum sp.]MDP1668015.1 DNA polymerase III subunit gamma/tau [Phaeovulum sp.]MDZ4119464.1 DNA polymerase III subunit gamma/tau [Phaeovulum sp.]